MVKKESIDLKQQGKLNKQLYPDDWFRMKINNGSSVSDLIKECNVSSSVIYTKLNELGLKTKQRYQTYEDISVEWIMEQVKLKKTEKEICCILGTNYETWNRIKRRYGLIKFFQDYRQARLKEKFYKIDKDEFLKLIVNYFKITDKIINKLTDINYDPDKLKVLSSLKGIIIPEKTLKKELDDTVESMNMSISFTDSDIEELKGYLGLHISPELTYNELRIKLDLDPEVFNKYIKKYQLNRLLDNNVKNVNNEDKIKKIAEKIKSGMSLQKIADEMGVKQHHISYFVRKYGLNSEELMGSRKRHSTRKGQKKTLKNEVVS